VEAAVASADLEAAAAVVLADSEVEVLAAEAQEDRGNRMNKHLWLQSALRFTPGSNALRALHHDKSQQHVGTTRPTRHSSDNNDSSAPRALHHDKSQQHVCKATHTRHR
jgi:hypothetical protein